MVSEYFKWFEFNHRDEINKKDVKRYVYANVGKYIYSIHSYILGNIDKSLVYSGNLKLTDNTEIDGMNAGKMVLSPTRTYAPVIKKILDNYRDQIHGMVHCSGGAQTKVLNFVENLHIVKAKSFLKKYLAI